MTKKYIEKFVKIFKEKFKEKFREKFEEKYIEKFRMARKFYPTGRKFSAGTGSFSRRDHFFGGKMYCTHKKFSLCLHNVKTRPLNLVIYFRSDCEDNLRLVDRLASVEVVSQVGQNPFSSLMWQRCSSVNIFLVFLRIFFPVLFGQITILNLIH